MLLIPQNKINQLIAYKYLLSAKQKQDILNALQTGSGVHIKPTKTQMGRGLGTILTSIGKPIAMKLVKKLPVGMHRDWGEVLLENKMAMKPLDWVCTKHLLLSLEHGNRYVVAVKKKELERAKACY